MPRRDSWEVSLSATPEFILPRSAEAERREFSHAELDRIERRLDRLSTALDSAVGDPRHRRSASAPIRCSGWFRASATSLGLGLSGYFLLEARRLGAPASLLTPHGGECRRRRGGRRGAAARRRVRRVLQGEPAELRAAARAHHRSAQPQRQGRQPEEVWSFEVRNLVLIVAAFLLGLWSLFAWGVYALLGYAGGFAAGNADFIPLPPELTFWVAEPPERGGRRRGVDRLADRRRR